MNEQTIDRLIDLEEVMRQVGMKKSKLYAEIKAGRFPAPVTQCTPAVHRPYPLL